MENRFLHIFLLPLYFLFFTGCIDDSSLNPVPVAPESDRIELKLSLESGNFQIPVTRHGAADESAIRNVWVFLFKGNNNSATFVEAVAAVMPADGSSDKPKVTLKKQSDACRILLLANPESQVFLPDATGRTDYKTLEELKEYIDLNNITTLKEVCDLLTTEPLQNGYDIDMGERLPFENGYLPMSYIYNADNGINNLTVITATEKMERAVARMIVTYSPEESLTGDPTLQEEERKEFVFYGISTVINASQRGKWHRLGASLPVSNGDVQEFKCNGYRWDLTGTRAVGDEDLPPPYSTDPIYLYESEAVTSGDNPYIIIRAKYTERKGDDSSNKYPGDVISGTYYYKLELIDKNGTPLDILRNNSYNFVIKSVRGPGYNSVANAIESKASNIDLDYEIFVADDLSSYEMVANNDYYLAVSNSIFLVYGNQDETYHAFTLSTNYDRNFAEDSRQIIATSGGIDIIEPAGGIIDGPLTDQEVKIKINWLNGYWNQNTPWKGVGTLEIRLGNLKKEIEIRRAEPVSTSGTGNTPLVFCEFEENENGDRWFNYDYYLATASVEKGSRDVIKLAVGEPVEKQTSEGAPLPGLKRDDPSVFSEDGQIQLYVEGGGASEGVVYMSTTRNPGWNPGHGTQVTRRVKVLITKR